MKLRIRGNSIRLRLLRGEVAEFAANGVLRETVDFGATRLTYTLQSAENEKDFSAHFKDDEIVVRIPARAARQWTTTDSVSLSGEQKISNAGTLKILIEKDFVCLERAGDEDNKDAYPNLSHKCR